MTTPADGYVQVAPNSTGSKVDTRELTRTDGNVVERQVTVSGDPNIPANIAGVDPGGFQRTRDESASELLKLVVIELRVMNLLVAQDMDVDLQSIRDSVINELIERG